MLDSSLLFTFGSLEKNGVLAIWLLIFSQILGRVTSQDRATSDIFEFQIKRKFKTQNRTEKIFFSFGPVP